MLQQALGQRRGRLGETGQVALEQREDAARPRQQRLGPAHAVVGRDRLGREGRYVGPAGEGQMQLGGAPADLPDALQHRGGFRRFGDLVAGQQALLVDEAVERGAGDAPGVALVLDEGVHHRQRAAVFMLQQLDAAEQRRRVLEMRDVGQEAADLDLGMNAGGDTAQDLHHVFAVHDHARVGLLALDRVDGLDLRQRRARRKRWSGGIRCVARDRSPSRRRESSPAAR